MGCCAFLCNFIGIGAVPTCISVNYCDNGHFGHEVIENYAIMNVFPKGMKVRECSLHSDTFQKENKNIAE